MNLDAIGRHRRLGFVTAAVCCIQMLVGMAPAHAVAVVPTTPFTASIVGVYDGPGNEASPEVSQWSLTEPVFVQTGTLPTAYGRFRAEFGSNGFDIQVAGGTNNLQVAGGSLWSDSFTVSGGSGSGTLTMSGRIQGTVTGAAEMAYAVFASSHPFDLNTIIASVGEANAFGTLELPNATRVLYTGLANGCGSARAPDDCAYAPYRNFEGTFDATVAAAVQFTYGQPLYVVSLFAGGVDIGGGNASFYNSANFGISAPAGSEIITASGTIYTAAVPEPAMGWMLVAGMLLVLGRVCSRSRA